MTLKFSELVEALLDFIPDVLEALILKPKFFFWFFLIVGIIAFTIYKYNS